MATLTKTFSVRDYDLAATLTSGQAFRWRMAGEAWEGVVRQRWVRVIQLGDALIAETAEPACDWSWLEEYLQLHLELDPVLAGFPQDEAMRSAVAACRGLRLLRQDPWECLASFILSSTKQIVQIQQIVSLLAARFGSAVAVPSGHSPAYAFPSVREIARLTEQELRACKMGFRAPYLLGAARMVIGGEVDLNSMQRLDLMQARGQLMRLPGVGRKIADCVLLFAYGFQNAFPVDVWIMKALRQLYFPRRRPTPKRLLRFTETYFGPHAGYAQQYLFHYMRLRQPRNS